MDTCDVCGLDFQYVQTLLVPVGDKDGEVVVVDVDVCDDCGYKTLQCFLDQMDYVDSHALLEHWDIEVG